MILVRRSNKKKNNAYTGVQCVRNNLTNTEQKTQAHTQTNTQKSFSSRPTAVRKDAAEIDVS